MAANASVLLTVTFTVERYIGVCHPMKGKVLCTPQRAKLFIALVTLLAVVCTVPELFEMEVIFLSVSLFLFFFLLNFSLYFYLSFSLQFLSIFALIPSFPLPCFFLD